LRKKKNTKAKTIDLSTVTPQEQDNHLKNKPKPRTENQKKYIQNIHDNVITFCQGVAGSGKTHLAVGLGLEYLLTNKVKKIIVTRPVLEAGEKIGYLPGTAEEKLHPYLLPIIDEINYFISASHHASLRLNNKIEIVPLGLMRGRNFHNCFIVADECQNASYDQLKMLLTRVGLDSKMVLTGDIAQSDLARNLRGGFISMINLLSEISGIGLSKLDNTDIVRNPIIAKILDRLEIYENEGQK
jgi:phosphate starvation-inducible PhoH-like protein